MSKRFVLLDRDGTINEEVDYVLEPGQLRLIPGSAAAIRELRALGLGVVVVTNQSPVGRGWLTLEQLDAIHAHLRELLAEEGAVLDGIYACPHAPSDGCDCRKPAPGLARRAAEEHGFEPTEAFVVGDHKADVEMGRTLGATTILLRTGHGEQELENGAGAFADHVAADLRGATEVIGGIVLSGAAR